MWSRIAWLEATGSYQKAFDLLTTMRNCGDLLRVLRLRTPSLCGAKTHVDEIELINNARTSFRDPPD